jgi:hypothetical protein
MNILKFQEAVGDLINQIKENEGNLDEIDIVVFSDDDDELISLIKGLGCYVRPSDNARMAYIETDTPEPLSQIDVG